MVNKDAAKSISELGINTILSVASKYASDEGKKHVENIVAEMAIEAGASFIPGISGAISSYKRTRFEKNMYKLIEELNQRLEEIDNNLRNKTEEQREDINKLFGFILDYVADEPQEKKIKYLVNGFVNITAHESVTEDFVLTYYDTLNQLRLVDISVLRLYSQNYFPDTDGETFQDVMDKHGISYDQYESVRNNLLRLGLLNSITEEENITKDLESIFNAINEIHKYLSIASGKAKGTLSNLKKPKKQSKKNRSNRLKLSRFGVDFVKFFLTTN